MIEPLEPKTSGAIKDYGIDWSVYLADTPDVTIQASEWTIESELGSPDLEVDADSIDELKTLVRLSGGEPGREYLLKNRVTLSNGEQPEEPIKVRVKSLADVASL